ncbi:hypothetical protein PTTG_11047, partial [Puccinia triticina 1-1 BBBD Race 1]
WEERIDIFLKASAKANASTPKKEKKEAVHLHHLFFLAKQLIEGTAEEKATLDLALVAFWGMARLAELTYESKEGSLDKLMKLLTSDVSTIDPTQTVLTLRSAKTCKPGETQQIKLAKLPHALCPTLAVQRRLDEAGGKKTSLFGYNEDGERRHLTRAAVISVLFKTWARGSFHKLSGHSFRVGGASLRMALGISTEEICALGRWQSNCYKLYIRQYSAAHLDQSLSLLSTLEDRW